MNLSNKDSHQMVQSGMVFRRNRTSDDQNDHEFGHFNKRFKPLGLRLSQSASLLEVIQKSISRRNFVEPNQDQTAMIDVGYTGSRKAANFPAFLMRIGSWEYITRFTGDLVVKYYFSKSKLTWEMLHGPLKRKIEISWSDVLDLEYNCPETGHGFFSVVLGRKPLFYTETNPVPRKHTIWELTDDFTDGQASTNRQHFLYCSDGVLKKHVEFFDYLRRMKPNVVIPASMLFESINEGSSSNRGEEETGEGRIVKEGPDWEMLEKKGVRRSIFYDDLMLAERNRQQMMKSLAERSGEVYKRTALENISESLMSDAEPETESSNEETIMSSMNSYESLLKR